MDTSNEQFKKYIQEGSSDVPSNFDWEHMQDGIFEKMESIREEEERKPKRRIGFWLFLLSAVVLSFLLIPQTMKQDEVADNRNKNADQSSISVQSLNKESNEISEKLKELEPTSTPSKITKTGAEQIASLKKQELYKDMRKQVDRPKVADKKLFGYVNREQSGIDEADVSKPEERMEEAPLSSAPWSDMLNESQTASIPNNQAIETLPSRGAISLKSARIYRMMAPNNSTSASNEAVIMDKRRIIFDGGVTFWDPGYDNAPERESYESALASYHLQANYLHPLKNNFFLMVGLNYQQLESVFDYETTIDDYRITLYDTIVGVENNLINGEQNVLRGDVELMVQADRRVKHYNKTRLLQLPFGLGKTWHQRRFQTDLLLGGVVNLWTQNQGRTLYQGQVVDYKGQSNAVISNQWSIHAMLGTRLTYHLNESIGLSTGIQLQKSLSNWSNEEITTMRPLIFNWHVGTSYHF